MTKQKTLAEIRYANACAALESIQQHLDELYAAHQANPFDWGLVGDLGRYEEQLMELVHED